MRTILACVLLCACGPGPRPNGDDGTVDAATSAVVIGKVYAPNQGPGQVPPGEEIPIAGALVYVTDTPPPPIPDHVYCEQCVATPETGVLSGPDGSFTLSVPPGSYTLVIQKGQYRIDQQVTLALGTLPLPTSQTTLPSQWKPEAGLYMPKIAMAQGTNDQIEDILGKLGVGTLSGNTFASPMGENGPEIVIYQYAGTAATSVTYLLKHIDEMRKYHIIFFPCSTDMFDLDALLRNQTVLANVRRYVNEGGKLYVTDWSGELADRAFPHQIQLGDDGADSEGTYDPTALTGALNKVGSADGLPYDLTDGKAVDPDLHAWLGTQIGPTESNPTPQIYNPDVFEVTDLWNFIPKTNAVQLGTDMMGMPVYDTPKVWVTGTDPDASGGAMPIAVTYQPTGCGKVLYTPFQTANTEHEGLFPQERVLLYLIMEIQTCSDNPIL
jgi:hypothetical protein